MMCRPGVGCALALGAVLCCGSLRAFAQATEQTMEDFSLFGVGEKGRKSWDLKGKSADIGAEEIRLDDIVSTVYGEQDTVRLTADKGAFNRSLGSLHLEQDVVVKSTSGITLTTDSLDWDRKQQLVSTPDAVQIARQDILVTGQGAKGFPDLNKVDLEKNIKVTIDPADAGNETAGRRMVITCDGPLQLDYQRNIALFHVNVQVKSTDALIKADTMEVYFVPEHRGSPADLLDVSSSAGRSKIAKIIARGDVSITQGENVSYSDEAVYSVETQRVVLQGRPRLVIFSTEELDAPVGD